MSILDKGGGATKILTCRGWGGATLILTCLFFATSLYIFLDVFWQHAVMAGSGGVESGGLVRCGT